MLKCDAGRKAVDQFDQAIEMGFLSPFTDCQCRMMSASETKP
jgi:hypothetical protein